MGQTQSITQRFFGAGAGAAESASQPSSTAILGKIPKQVIVNHLLPLIGVRTSVNLAFVSQHFSQMLETQLKIMRLLNYVARGQQDEVRKILLETPKLLFEKGMLIDYSDRTFYNTSAFQYAWWALDWRMLVMMLRVLAGETDAKESLTELYARIQPEDRETLQQQLDEMNEDHVDYRGSHHGKRYHFENLLAAYTDFNRESTRRPEEDYSNNAQLKLINHLWLTRVAAEQSMVPADFAQETLHHFVYEAMPTHNPASPTFFGVSLDKSCQAFNIESLDRNLRFTGRTHSFNGSESKLSWFPIPEEGSNIRQIGKHFGVSRGLPICKSKSHFSYYKSWVVATDTTSEPEFTGNNGTGNIHLTFSTELKAMEALCVLLLKKQLELHTFIHPSSGKSEAPDDDRDDHTPVESFGHGAGLA